MYKVHREDAIRWISQFRLARMNADERLNCLVCEWYSNGNSFEYYMLSDELKKELDTQDEFSDVMNPKWYPMILEYLIVVEYTAVSNLYLKKLLIKMGVEDQISVYGEIEPKKLTLCECCGYLVPMLICDICGWSDTKPRTEAVYGRPNKGISLSEAQANFSKTGSCFGESSHIEWLEHVTPDRYERFNKPEQLDTKT